jgi:hypothetical protein
VGQRGMLRPFHARQCLGQPHGSGLASLRAVAVVTGC